MNGRDQREAHALVDALLARHFAPPPALSVETWTDGRLVLPRESTAEPGPLRLARTPYLAAILRDLSDPRCEEVALMFGTQLGKSTVLLALLGYVVDHDPAPVMMVQPTLDLAKKFSKQRVQPIVAANPTLANKIRDTRAREGASTMLVKEFTGGILVITGANSASGLASMPAKILLFDEVDDYPDDAGGQGEPIRIATARQDTFARRKRLKTSSPKRPKGRSTIEHAFESGTRCDYYVPCPHCGGYQVLQWGQVRWRSEPRPDPDSAAYACAACGALIEESAKPLMLARGQWRAAAPDAKVRSYRLNSLYSPMGWLAWRSLVSEYLDAKRQSEEGNRGPLRTFYNTRLAQTWEQQAEQIAVNELLGMAEAFPLRTVPAEGLLLVAMVDVQDDRFEIGVWAAGERGDLFTVDHRVIPANPGLEDDWEKVDAALRETYPHANGRTLGISAAAVDSGGHYTHDVYRFARGIASHRKVAVTKGMDRPGMPILGRATPVDVNWKGGVIRGGVKLWMVGVNSAKDALYARIQAGRVHMSRDLPAEWFEQLAAEHRVLHRTARGERTVWVKVRPGARNEALDCAVGCLWVLERLGVSRWPKAYWETLRERVRPDLFAELEPATPAPDPPPPTGALRRPPLPDRRAPKKGFVGAWK